jgi:C4-dicarboxylate-specific signal transduction histidine kinase
MNFVERYRRIADLPRPDPKPLSLRKFVDDIDALMQPGFASRGINYGSQLRPAELVLSADAGLLSQAVINLLHNAAEAVTGRNDPAILFSCTGRDQQILFEVVDNGAGVPAERREDIFVPFFTTKPFGSGIGLTLARQIALAHGGQIEAQENEGGGMVFRMTLPAA